VGRQAVVDNVFTVLGRDWVGYRFELQSLVAGDDQIVGVGTYHGTCQATGKEMHARVAHVWQLLERRILAFEQFTDTLLVNQGRWIPSCRMSSRSAG
jgi:uncharacterized protein